MTTNFILSVLIGYLLGSIPFTQVVAKAVKGIDLRTVGSHNVGGRNLMRSVGLGWGFLGGLLDVAKGLLAMVVAQALSVPYPLAYYVGMAAVAGHNWPIWLRFRGGKGLATALGAALWVVPSLTLISLAIALILFLFTRNIMLTGLTGFIGLFITVNFLAPESDYLFLIGGLFIVVLLASLSDVIHKLSVSGGVREYLSNPNKVYEEEAKERKG